MQDPKQFQEIENLGEEEEELFPVERQSREGGSIFPLFQAALCVLALLALLVLKFTNAETYDKVTNWYQSEVTREIELPKWKENQEKPPLTSSASPSETSLPAELSSGSLQRL